MNGDKKQIAHRKCKVDGCDKPHEALGLCIKHYKRLKRYGDLSTTLKLGNGEIEKFYQSVVRNYEGDECLIWPFSKTSGYGHMHRGLVSRILCIDTYGSPPTPRHHAAHSCGKGHLGCVTKRHLRWKTPRENMADKATHGTLVMGENCNLSKLSDVDVMAIIAARGVEKQKHTAARFGTTQSNVSQIQNGKSRRYLSNPRNSSI